jgi:hypothetical protein
MANKNYSSDSPTTKDNPINRAIEFLIYVILEFNTRGSKVLLVSMDKSKSDAKGYEQYLSKGIETSIGAGGAIVAGQVGFKLGKFAGKPLGFLTSSKCSIIFLFPILTSISLVFLHCSYLVYCVKKC